jgi:hypothetical protein
MTEPIVCPRCHDRHAAPIHVTIETSSRAAKRRPASEAVHICPACGVLLILSLELTPQKASAS